MNPTTTAKGWNDGFQVICQLGGPLGGAEKLYMYETQEISPYESSHFYWRVPDMVEAGTYQVTTFISGLHISSTEVRTAFVFNDIRATNLTAIV